MDSVNFMRHKKHQYIQRNQNAEYLGVFTTYVPVSQVLIFLFYVICGKSVVNRVTEKNPSLDAMLFYIKLNQ